MAWKSLEQLTEELDPLGLPYALYKPRPFALAFGFLLAVVLALAGVALIGGAAAGVVRPRLFLIGGGLLLLAAAGAVFEFNRRRLYLRIFLFDDALLRVEHDRFLLFPWAEIDAVWVKVEKHHVHGVPVSTSHTYTVRRADGTRIVFKDEVQDIVGLGKRIQEEVLSRRLPEAVERYNQGETLSFGRFDISPAGLGYRGATLPWAELKSVTEDDGTVVVRKQGKWFAWAKTAAADVPNLPVFLALVQEIALAGGEVPSEEVSKTNTGEPGA